MGKTRSGRNKGKKNYKAPGGLKFNTKQNKLAGNTAYDSDSSSGASASVFDSNDLRDVAAMKQYGKTMETKVEKWRTEVSP